MCFAGEQAGGAKRRVGGAALVVAADDAEIETAPLTAAAAAAAAVGTGAAAAGGEPTAAALTDAASAAFSATAAAAAAAAAVTPPPMTWRESAGRLLPVRRMWRDTATLPLFRTAVLGYASGLAVVMFASRVFTAAQPALLWIVPAMLGPLAWHARAQGSLSALWLGAEAGR